jgi:hypothetical protein
MAFVLEPMHRDVLLWQLTLQRVVILQPVHRRHPQVRTTYMKKDGCGDGIDVGNRGGREYALRLVGRSARGEGKRKIALGRVGEPFRRGVDWEVDVSLVEVLRRTSIPDSECTS